MDREAIAARINGLNGWELINADNAIKRHFDFSNFREAWGFVEKVAELAEAENHHPDITFGWGYVELVFTTHDAKGLTEKDFEAAAKVNTLQQVQAA